MEDLIKKLIKVDEDARQKVVDAEKARADVVNLLLEKKQELTSQAVAKFDKDLAQAQQNEQQRIDNAFSEDNLKVSNQKIIDKLEKNYNENCEQWVQGIINNVVGE
ncbi:MAG: hypothetical protein R3Y27_03265 [Clostridia bacterium]